MLEGTAAVERSPRLRAKVTNNLWQSPDGLDQRSPRGRRWRDLLDGLIAEYGTAYPEKLRSLAVLKLSLEATQAAVLRGDILRSEDIVRLENLIGRREREEALARFREGSLRALVSARVLNEGMDVPDAAVAIVVGGSQGEREHVQRVGRVLRPLPGKRAVIYELITRRTMEVRQARRRREALAPRVSACL